MTSRNLCFKMMAEDLKRRVWAIAATILAFLFAMVIPVAIKTGEYLERTDWSVETRARMARNLMQLFYENPFVIIALILLAVVWGVSSFSYLHDRKKVDLYHSLPVKRGQLFWARYANGILLPALLYGLTVLGCLGLAAPSAVISADLAWKAWFLYMAFYSLLYTTMVLAMMLTGNLVVALLGFGVFCAYVPAVTLLIFAYRDIWFQTLYVTLEEMALRNSLLVHGSPFTVFFSVIDKVGRGLWPLSDALWAWGITALLAVVSGGLYLLRPSEAAGRAMAFQKICTPVKVLLTIPVAVCASIFFFCLRPNLVWLLFGAVCGTVLCHCLIEIIYHFDFRKLFSGKACLAVCMMVSVLLALAGYYDWYGYDSWLPDGDKVESAAVILGYQDDWVTYGKPERREIEEDINAEAVWSLEESKKTDGLTYGYEWNYESQGDYVLENMEFHDTYLIMELARGGVMAAKDRRNFWGARYGEAYTTPYDIQLACIQFQMADGKKVVRQYRIPMDEHMTEIRDGIHDDLEFKKGIYPILAQTTEETAAVYFYQYGASIPVTEKQEEIRTLLEVYQRDLEELTMEDRRREIPVATIQFCTQELKEALDHNDKLEEDYYWNNLDGRCVYPIYPSFARTLGVLEQFEIYPAALDERIVSNIDVYYYGRISEINEESTYAVLEGEQAAQMVEVEEQEREYTAAEDLAAILPAVYPENYVSLNGYQELEEARSVNVTVTIDMGRLYEILSPEHSLEHPKIRQLDVIVDTGRLTGEQQDKYLFFP